MWRLLFHHATHRHEVRSRPRRIGALKFHTIDAARVVDQLLTRTAQPQQLVLHRTGDGDDCSGAIEHTPVVGST